MNSRVASPSPLFRFHQWNDMHVRAPQLMAQHPSYPLANEKATWALECARGAHDLAVPDFIVSAGDIINGEIPCYDDDYAYLRTAFLDQLTAPFLPCLGNHENGQGEGMPERNLAYGRWFGSCWHNYAFTHSGIAFIVVDTSGAHRPGDEVTAARNAFVRRAFTRFNSWPTCLVMHVPLIAMREEQTLKASFGFSSWRVLDTRLGEIIQEHADTVIAVLCGHIHLTGVRQQRGIYHVMPGGTCGYPSDFASFEVFGDHINVAMHRAPDRWLDRAGDIHGQPRHPVDHTDAEHPDHERYMWGNRDERALSIPLQGRKRPRPDAPRTLTVYHEMEPGQWIEAMHWGPSAPPGEVR